MATHDTAFETDEIREHTLQSQIVAQTYRIKVLQPIRLRGNRERFPVLYATDSDDFFGGYASLARILQTHGETPRFILVAIGYDNPGAAGLLRMRDLWAHESRALYEKEIAQLAQSPLVHAVDDLAVVNRTTDAHEFLQFIRSELMPFINRSYPTLSNDNNYFGYSGGGGFGLYTLFTQPDTFRRYILGSPATSYDGHNFAIELARSFARSGKAMDAGVFMSVGELEEFKKGLGKLDMVSGYYLLAKHLGQAAIPGLRLTTRVFPRDTHATAWTSAFSHGLKELFGPVDVAPFWPEYFKSG